MITALVFLVGIPIVIYVVARDVEPLDPEQEIRMAYYTRFRYYI